MPAEQAREVAGGGGSAATGTPGTLPARVLARSLSAFFSVILSAVSAWFLPAEQAREVAGGEGSAATGTPGTLPPTQPPQRGGGNQAKNGGSVKNIFRVIFHPMPIQQSHQLAAKIPMLVVALLRRDVFINYLNLREAHTERVVTGLPCELAQFRIRLVHPQRRVALQISQEVRHCIVSAVAGEYVYMIRHATYSVNHPLLGADDSANVFVQAGTDLRRDEAFAVFRAEDNVIEETLIGAGHGSLRFVPPPRWGGWVVCAFLGFRSLRSLHPRLLPVPALGAKTTILPPLRRKFYSVGGVAWGNDQARDLFSPRLKSPSEVGVTIPS